MYRPNVFHMFEAYSGGRDGFAAHSQTDHYAKWAEFKATEPFAAPAKVGYYVVDLDGHQERLQTGEESRVLSAYRAREFGLISFF